MKPVVLSVIALALAGATASVQASVEGCYEEYHEARKLIEVGTLPQDPRFLMIDTYDPGSSTQPSYYLEKALCYRPGRAYREKPDVGDVCYHLYNFVQISFDAEDRVTFWGPDGSPVLYMRAEDYKCK
jgi:hypothetical protein